MQNVSLPLSSLPFHPVTQCVACTDDKRIRAQCIIFIMILNIFRNIKDIDGNPYFHKYFESYYQLYIFTTTANSPDVG